MTTGAHTGNENSAAIDPTNPQHMVIAAKDYGLTGLHWSCDLLNVWVGVSVSWDGGASWASNYIPGYNGSEITPLSGYRCVTDPVVAFAPNGTLYVAGLAYDDEDISTDSLIWIARSLDGGETWDRVVAVDERPFNDKPWLSVDPNNGTLYVTWTVFGPGSHPWMMQIPNGDLDQLGIPHPISQEEVWPEQGAVTTVLGNGTVVAAWYRAGTIVATSSRDGGWTWTALQDLGPATRPSFEEGPPFRALPLPSIASDPRTGHAYVGWADAPNGTTSIVRVRASADGGSSWQDAQDISSASEQGYFPAVAVDDHTGDVHLVWYRFVGNRTSGLIDAYYSTSRDSGAKWSKPQRLTTISSEPMLSPHQLGGSFIGDYTGIAASAGIVRPVFLDTRNGRPDLMTAIPFAPPSLELSLAEDVLPLETIEGVVRVRTYTPLSGGEVHLEIPHGWEVIDAPGATVQNATSVVWSLAPTSADIVLGLSLRPTTLGESTFHANMTGAIRGSQAEIGSTDEVAVGVRVGCPRAVLGAQPVGPTLLDTGPMCA